MPVLTAHPTEAKRRAVVEHLSDRICWPHGSAWSSIGPRSTRSTGGSRKRSPGAHPIRRHRPEPLDQVRAVVDHTLFTTPPHRLSRDLGASTRTAAGAAHPSIRSCGGAPGWEGTAMHRRSPQRSRRPPSRSRRTTSCAGWRPPPGALGLRSRRAPEPGAAGGLARRRDAARLPDVATELERKLPDAPHRRKLGPTAHCLAATRAGAPAGNFEPRRTAADLGVLQRSLEERGGARVGRGTTPALAGRDLRVPPRLDGCPETPAPRRCARPWRSSAATASSRPPPPWPPRSARSDPGSVRMASRHPRDRELHPRPTISRPCIGWPPRRAGHHRRRRARCRCSRRATSSRRRRASSTGGSRTAG